MFNNAKTTGDRKTEVTVLWNRWRSQLFSWHPNILDFGPAGSWPLWQLRVLPFYAFTAALWLGYFYAFFWLHRRTDADEEVDAVGAGRPPARPSPWRASTG